MAIMAQVGQDGKGRPFVRWDGVLLLSLPETMPPAGDPDGVRLTGRRRHAQIKVGDHRL